eukprot:349967-Chlamydomonas_euryale.AAC.2
MRAGTTPLAGDSLFRGGSWIVWIENRIPAQRRGPLCRPVSAFAMGRQPPPRRPYGAAAAAQGPAGRSGAAARSTNGMRAFRRTAWPWTGAIQHASGRVLWRARPHRSACMPSAHLARTQREQPVCL